MWILVRFNSLGGSRGQLLTLYQLRVRSTVEFAASVFHSGQELSRKFEMVQKKSFVIILGSEYVSYENALTILDLDRLDARHNTITLNFANKCSKSPQHKHMLSLNPISRKNSRNKKKYKEYLCRTAQYFRSPWPDYSTRKPRLSIYL